jgi:hypothetical protein
MAMSNVVRVHEEAHPSGTRAGTANRRPAAAAHPVHALQRLVGNRAARRMLAESTPEQAPAAVERAVDAERGGGERLVSEVREPMEAAFGADFRDVRVHHDAAAAGLARQVGARAFATGSDVFFGAGTYQPSNSAGRELLAHELAHVVQQTGPGVRTKLEVGPPGDALEVEADRAARAVVEQESLRTQPEEEEKKKTTEPVLQGQPELENEEEQAG